VYRIQGGKMKIKLKNILVLLYIFTGLNAGAASYTMTSLSLKDIDEIEDKVSTAKGKFQADCMAAHPSPGQVSLMGFEFTMASVHVNDSPSTIDGFSLDSTVQALGCSVNPAGLYTCSTSGLIKGTAVYNGGEQDMTEAYVEKVIVTYSPPAGTSCVGISNYCGTTSAEFIALKASVNAAWSGISGKPSWAPEISVTPVCEEIAITPPPPAIISGTENYVIVPLPTGVPLPIRDYNSY
jgi:hypothetical protein